MKLPPISSPIQLSINEIDNSRMNAMFFDVHTRASLGIKLGGENLSTKTCPCVRGFQAGKEQ